MDLDDLNLLDDERAHAYCTICHPEILPPLTTYIAICGKRSIVRRENPVGWIPPNACEECLALPCQGLHQ
jgi:hypothetical protein